MIQVDLHICFEWVVRNPPTNSDAVIKSISPVDIGKSPVIYRLSYMFRFFNPGFLDVFYFFHQKNGPFKFEEPAHIY